MWWENMLCGQVQGDVPLFTLSLHSQEQGSEAFNKGQNAKFNHRTLLLTLRKLDVLVFDTSHMGKCTI